MGCCRPGSKHKKIAASASAYGGSSSDRYGLKIAITAGGLSGTTYGLRCVANDADGEVHVLTAALPVKTASPG